MTDWSVGGGIAGLAAVALLLIWRIVRLGIDQEKRLLTPAYEQIDKLEKRIEHLEIRQRECEDERARFHFLLRINGIPIEKDYI